MKIRENYVFALIGAIVGLVVQICEGYDAALFFMMVWYMTGTGLYRDRKDKEKTNG